MGATGPVGRTPVPVLAAAGAEIVATARTTEAAELPRRLGADRTVGCADCPNGVDVVFDLALYADGLPSAARSLRPGGRLISIIFPPPEPSQLGRDDVEQVYRMHAGELRRLRGQVPGRHSGSERFRIRTPAA
ncbi:zinc-binding dehydrogenase [Actinoplanes sp. NPDC020271]|uniref:zinc-binding dehydrogenase n=1 Tax=Actinoplanes sp. NPDC020271 TaxID=3363896 RepID=UPI0037A09927